MKAFIALMSLLVLLYHGTIFYIDNHIDTKVYQRAYENCHKVWASRGVYGTHAEQNSLFAFQRAFDVGHLGVEVDFYYDTSLDKFIVSHNKPYVGEDGQLVYTLKDGKLFTLEELFKKTAKGHYYWLDYKNLEKLSSKETHKAICRLDAITKVEGLKERVYIEGSAPWDLDDYTDAGYKTLFAFEPLPYSSIIASLSSNIYKIGYYFFNITAVAMPYGKIEDPKYNEITQKNLTSIPTFLFHIPNDDKLLYSLVKKSDVRVMLIGRDQSISRPQITSCTRGIK